MREGASKGGVGRLNNVRSRERGRIAQVKLFGSLPHFIILCCHGGKLYISVSLSTRAE